jgi:hypothetical protein
MTCRCIIPSSGAQWMMYDRVKRLKAHLCWVSRLQPGHYVTGCTGGLCLTFSLVPYDGSRPKCKVCLALEAERDARLAERFPNCKSCEVTEALAGDYEVLEHLDGKLRRKVNAVLSPLHPTERK